MRSAKQSTPELGAQRYRHLPGALSISAKSVAAGISLFCLLNMGGVFSQFGVVFMRIQLNSIFLSVIVTLVFLLIPAGKQSPRDKVPWYDVLLIFASLASNVYIAYNAQQLVYQTRLVTNTMETVLGSVAIITLVEACRRTTGWAMVVVVLVFMLYGILGYLVPGEFGTARFSWERIMALVYISSTGIYGTLTSLASGVIIGFITFGVFFAAAGGGKFFMDLASSLVGSVRGGPAKAAIVGSALFGTISGASVANIVVTGSITIPMMKEAGYKPVFAGAVEAVASTGGMIMPPVMASVAFVMAELLGVPYATVALAAVLPAILYYAALYFQVDLLSAKLGLRGVPPSTSLSTTIKEGWQFFIPLVALVVFLFVLRYPAETSAAYSIPFVILVSLFRKETRITPGKLVDSLQNGTRDTLMIGALIAAAGIIYAMLSLVGLGLHISSGLVALSGESLLALLILSAVVCYIMGMGISHLVSYVILAALVVPAMIKFGVLPIAAHFFILFMGLSGHFTPPYCPASFVAGIIAQASPFRVGILAMRLGIVVFIVPFFFAYNPVLLLIGSWGEIALATITALIGLFALSVALEGYMLGPCNWMQRIFAGIAGIAMIIPGWATDITGIALLCAVALWQWRTKKVRVTTAEQVP